MGVVDLHRRLGSIVAETAVLLQQLQTFIAIINWAPTVVCTQHCKRQVNKMEKKKYLGSGPKILPEMFNRYEQGIATKNMLRGKLMMM